MIEEETGKIAQDLNELKTKVGNLEGDLLCRTTKMKAMTLHVVPRRIGSEASCGE